MGGLQLGLLGQDPVSRFDPPRMTEETRRQIDKTIQMIRDRPWGNGVWRGMPEERWPGELFYSRLLRIRRHHRWQPFNTFLEARIWLFHGRFEVVLGSIPKDQWERRKRMNRGSRHPSGHGAAIPIKENKP